jgi:2-amino-4-hydroxy-6-hydroxymethyldihydropteridine diphosphokinase
MARVYLGLGSNIDPEDNLRLGIQELRRYFGELSQSAIYQSAAVGFEGADFLNMVVVLQSDDTPEAIQAQAELIHGLAGRKRASGRFTSRPLDIDLLLYGDRVVNKPMLTLPRSDVLEYSFVLRPLAELDPGLTHPVTGRTMAEHWQVFDATSHPLRPVDVIL